VEGLSDVTKSYLPLPTDPDSSITPDITVPPFSKVPVPSALKLFVYLDTARPLSEPKWAKTGDVQDWLKSMFGRMFWVAGDAAEGWEKKIHVVDPDPVWFIYIKLLALYSTLFYLAPDNLDSSGWLVYKFPGRCTERTPTIP
jgi:20S proteasome subunit alpha 6